MKSPDVNSAILSQETRPTPFLPPSGPARRLAQGPPVRSKFLAALAEEDRGGSEYPGVEVALSYWLRKDVSAANQWFENNQDSLSPEGRDDSRVAFALEALSFDELDTASQWISSIESKDRRTKLEGEIAAKGKEKP